MNQTKKKTILTNQVVHFKIKFQVRFKYENKILQMKKMLGKKTETKQEKPKFIKPDPPSYTKAWQQQGLELIENDFGVLFKREVHYPFMYQHGDYRLGELFHALKRWKSQGEDHPFAISEDETIVFFDTETTGLKGAGTHIFLLGFLEANDEGFTPLCLAAFEGCTECVYVSA